MSNIFADDLARKEASRASNPFAADLAAKERRKKLKTKLAEGELKAERIANQPDPMSVGGIAGAVASELGERLSGIAGGVVALGKTIYPFDEIDDKGNVVERRGPYDTLTHGPSRRELVRGVDDIVTLGYGQKLAGNLESDLNALGVYTPPEKQLNATSADDRVAAPGKRVGGNLIGIVTPGLGKNVGTAGVPVARELLGGGGALRGGARAVTAYGLGAPAIAGLHASSAGDRVGAALDAATDPVGLTLAGTAGLVGGGVSKRIRESRGAKAREFIEREGKGAKVGVTSPGKGGVFADELAGVEPTDKGIGVAARRGAEGVLKGLKEEHRIEVSRPYQAMKAMIDNSPDAARARDIGPIVANMESAVWDLETAPQARSALEGQLKILREHYADPKTGAVMVPERQLNGLRRTLMRLAKVGQTDAPGEKEAPLRSAAFEAKRMVDEGPYAPLNEFYAHGAERMAASRENLGLKRRPSADSAVDRRKVKLSLEREAQNTRTAGGDSKLEAFRAAHPELATQSQLANLAKARADLSFRLTPQHGGLIERAAGDLGPAAAIGTAAAAGGVPGALGAAGIMGLTNATPIAGRLLYPMAGSQAGNPILWALDEQRRRSAERAAFLRGGGR